MANTPRKLSVEIDPKVDMTKIRKEIEELSAKLREERRLAHEAAQELRDAIKSFKEAKREFLSNEEIALALRKLGKREMERYSSEIAKAIAEGTQAAYDRFDAIIAICMGTDPQSVRDGQRSLEDLLRNFIDRRGLPWQLVATDDAEWPEAFRGHGFSIRTNKDIAPDTALLVSSAIRGGKLVVNTQRITGLVQFDTAGGTAGFLEDAIPDNDDDSTPT